MFLFAVAGLLKGRPVVVVSGLPRSGTSMVMQMLAAGGFALVTDGRRKGDQDNPRGYFELEEVTRLEGATDRSWLKECRGKAVKVISFLLRHLPACCAYRVIFIERDLEEVLRSQKEMLRRRGGGDGGAGDRKLREDFRRHLEEVKAFLESRDDMDALYVDYASVIADPAAAAARIATFVGGDLDQAAMAGAVIPSLRRSRNSSR